LARTCALVGLVAGGLYLVWRVTATMAGVPLWLSLPMLAVDVIGVASVALLTWALWPSVDGRPTSAVDDDTPIDVVTVVRAGAQRIDALRATLLSTRSNVPVVVVDRLGRRDVAALCDEFDVRLLPLDAGDLDGLVTAAAAVDASALFVVDPGDVPDPNAISRLWPWLAEPRVAIVQGRVVSAPGESGEIGPADRDEREFERAALLPALGRRGVATYTGSGALVRRAAVERLVHPVHHGSAADAVVHANISTIVALAGWQIVAPGGAPVVATAPLVAPADVERARAAEASAARHLVVTALSPRVSGLPWRVRAAMLALAVRPLAGVRRSLLVAVLCASLLDGRLPFAATWAGIGLLWFPSFVLGAGSLWAMSDGTLRPGDRLRWSMRVLGASWHGLLAVRGRVRSRVSPIGELFGVGHGGSAALAVGALSTVICLRAMSERLTHTLRPMPSDQLVGLLVAVLWTLAGGLDALRLLARRSRHRRATRIQSSLPATIAGRPAIVVDLTMIGAGVMSVVDVEVGAEHVLDVVVPTASGCVSASVPILVRNSRADFSGDRHVGVEFTKVEPYVADALSEFCLVQPALEALGRPPLDDLLMMGVRWRPTAASDPSTDRRLGLRAAALVAVIGAMACTLPTRAEASTDGAAGSMRGAVVVEGAPRDAAGGSLATIVCTAGSGPDGRLGTSDDRYTAPISAQVGTDGLVELPTQGSACWWSLAPVAGYLVDGDAIQLATDPDPLRLMPDVAAVAGGDRIAITATVFLADGSPIAGSTETAEPLQGVTVALIDERGAVRSLNRTTADGAAAVNAPGGRYHLAVSNLPTGVHPPGVSAAAVFGAGPSFDVAGRGEVLAPAFTVQRGAPSEAASSPERILPEPPVATTAVDEFDGGSLLGTLVVVLLAGLIGLSVLVGSLEPFSRRRLTLP
jgi:hypothetical protein